MLAGPLVVVLLAAAAGAETPPRIPVREGLTVVTAVDQTMGDYESIKRVIAVTPAAVKLSYSSESAQGERTRARRTVKRADMETAREYKQGFAAGEDAAYPGTTALGVSTAVLEDLKTRGRTDFACMASGLAGGLGSGIGRMLQGLPGVDPKDVAELNAMSTLRGTLTRSGDSVPFPVLVNDRRVTLRGIRAAGRLGDTDAEFLFLDDPANPLTLRFRLGDEKLEVVKISFPEDAAAPSVEQTLQSAGRAELYGIYFDFGKDTLREESSAVLDQVAAALARNTSWRVRIEGHTDGIGDAQANLDLSRRRAEAVRSALVVRGADATRLSTAGYGATRPREANDTLAGRARNRRVELALQGHPGGADTPPPPVATVAPAASGQVTPSQPSSTAAPPTSPPSLDAAAALKGLPAPGRVLLKDDFSNPNSGFASRVRDDQWTGYAEGGLRMKFTDRTLTTSLLESFQVGNARIEVDVTNRGGETKSAFGVFARYDDASRANPGPVFYRFLIDASGGAAVEAVRYKGYSLPAPKLTPHPAVKPGAARNHLTIDLVGDLLVFSVNGQPVGAIREGSTARGQVGFTVSTDGPLDVLFDDFTVFER